MSTPNSQLNSAAHLGLHVDVRSSGPVHLQAQFDCAPGELVALVGASGSGKTTLLRTIAGLHQSADLAGSVRLGAQVWMDSSQGILLPPQQRRVGLVFQSYALFPHLNAINNIAICVDGAGDNALKSSQNIARDWLARLGMSDLAERLPHELSGGQQQRVALARAAVRIQSGQGTDHKNTRGDGDESTHGDKNESTRGDNNGSTRGVLLLDEPFSAVDAPMRQVLYRELAQLRQALHVPIVLVTHDLHEARRLADRMVIIDGGQAMQSGPPAQVMRSPRNARVAALVGIHNHFSAQFHKAAGHNASEGQALLDWGDLKIRVKDKSKIESGTAVTWVLAGEAVQVLSSDAADASDQAGAATTHAQMQTQTRANHLHCTVSEMLPLGEISLCRLAVSGTPDTIVLNLPTALLAAMGAVTGGEIKLSVPVDAAHIMPLRV